MKPPPQKLKSPMRKNNIGADFHVEALSPTVRAPSASNVKRMENSALLSIRSRPASPLQNFNVFDLKSQLLAQKQQFSTKSQTGDFILDANILEIKDEINSHQVLFGSDISNYDMQLEFTDPLKEKLQQLKANIDMILGNEAFDPLFDENTNQQICVQSQIQFSSQFMTQQNDTLQLSDVEMYLITFDGIIQFLQDNKADQRMLVVLQQTKNYFLSKMSSKATAQRAAEAAASLLDQQVMKLNDELQRNTLHLKYQEELIQEFSRKNQLYLQQLNEYEKELIQKNSLIQLQTAEIAHKTAKIQQLDYQHRSQEQQLTDSYIMQKKMTIQMTQMKSTIEHLAQRLSTIDSQYNAEHSRRLDLENLAMKLKQMYEKRNNSYNDLKSQFEKQQETFMRDRSRYQSQMNDLQAKQLLCGIDPSSQQININTKAAVGALIRMSNMTLDQLLQLGFTYEEIASLGYIMSSSTQIQAQTFLDMIHLDVDFHIPKQTQTKDYFQQATKAQLLNQGKLTTSQINFPSKEDLLTSRKQQNPRTYIDQVENNTNVCSKSVINHSVQTDKVLSYQTESEAVPNKQLLNLTEQQQLLFMTKDQEHLSIGAQSLKKQTKSKQCKMIQAKQKSSSPQKSVLFGSPSMQTENFKEQSHLIQYKSSQQFQNYHQVSNTAFADLPKKNQSVRCHELSSTNIMQNNKYTDSSKSYSNSNISIEENDDIQQIQPLNRVSAASCQQSSRSSISDQHNLVLIADNSEKQVLKNTNSKYQQLHNSSLENSCSDSHITNKVGLKSELQQKSTNIIIDNNVPQQQQLRSPKTIVKYSGHIDSNVNNFCSPNITNTTQAYKNQQMISNSDKIIRNAVMISKIQPQFSSIQDLSSVQNDKLKTDITKYKISNQFTEDQPNESPQKINRLFTLEDLAPVTSENFERLNIGQGNILSNNHFTDALAKLEYQNNSSVVPIYNKSGDQVGFLDIKGQYQNVNNNQAPSLSQGLSPKDLVILNQIGRKKQTITVSQITLDMSPKPVLKNQQINQVQNTEKCNKLQRQLSQVQIKKQNFNYSRQKEQSSEVELSENNILNVETKLFNNSKDNLAQNVLQCDKVDQMNTTSSPFLNLELLPDSPQNPRSINDQLSQTFNEQDNIVVQENEQMEFELIKGQEQSIDISQKINPLFRIDYVCQKLSQQILYDYRENNKPYSNKDQVKQLKPHQEAINIKDIKLLENAVFSKAELITQQNKAKSLTLLYDRPLTQNKRTQSRQLNKQNYYTLEDYSKSIKSMNECNPLFISPSKLLSHPLCRITDEIIFSQTLLSEFYDENLFSKPSHSQSVDFLFMFEKESKLFQPALLCQNNTQLSDQIIRQNTELLYFNMKDDNALAQLSIKSLLPQPNDVVFAIRVNACSLNKQPIRIFKLLEEQFHLDLPATNIYNGLYVKIPLVCRLKSYSWVLRTINLLLDFRIKANNAYLIQHENEPDIGFENQCLDDKMNELHTFRKLAGMIGQETFIYPSDLLIQFARTRYGESNLILQFVFEFLVTLIYYQCSSEHSYLFARFFFNDFAPDFFLLYLEICVKMNLQFQYSAQTSHGNYLEQLSDYKIQTSRIPYLINALFHNWDDIRKFSITDLLQQEFDYDYHDLQHYVSIFQILPKIFSYYSLFRRISYQNSMLLFNYLARQENLVDAITIKQFRKMMELSQISFTNTQQNEFYFAFTRTAQSFHLSCVLNSRLLTQQQFGSLFICCQLGRFAAFSSSVLRGFVSTQIQRQISISKNMLADLELCLNTYLRMNVKCNQKAIYRIQKLLAIGYNDVSNYDYDASVSKLQLIVQNIIRLLSETSQGIELIFLNGLISCLRRILEI